MLYPSGSLPGVTLRPFSAGDRLLVDGLSPRTSRRGDAYLVHAHPLQADVGGHGGSEVAQPLQPQHSRRQARSRRSAAWQHQSAQPMQHQESKLHGKG